MFPLLSSYTKTINNPNGASRLDLELVLYRLTPGFQTEHGLGRNRGYRLRTPTCGPVASVACGIQGIRPTVFLHNKIAELVLFCLNIRAFFPRPPPSPTSTEDLQDWECCGNTPRRVPDKQIELWICTALSFGGHIFFWLVLYLKDRRKQKNCLSFVLLVHFSYAVVTAG